MPKYRKHARSKSLTSSGVKFERLNIRKFVAANSRDALRLVREALGADAVVLSNRTMDDGNVEIVALADSDLASIAPKAGVPTGVQAGVQAGVPAPARAPAGRPAPAATRPNPYANGAPDVFASVFGASPEVTGEVSAAPAPTPKPTVSMPAPAPNRLPSLPSPRASIRRRARWPKRTPG